MTVTVVCELNITSASSPVRLGTYLIDLPVNMMTVKATTSSAVRVLTTHPLLDIFTKCCATTCDDRHD